MGSAASPPGGHDVDGTILLVEDNPAYIRLVRELLTEAGLEGFQLEWADLLEKGLDRLEAGGVDLILLDLLLPDNMGTNTLEVVLEHAEETPIVVLTGIEDDELAREALDLGAADYLCKGRLDADRLARSVRYALSEATTETTSEVTPGSVETERVLPMAADRLEAAASCLEAVEAHLDPLAPEGTDDQVDDERASCRKVADGLREIAELVEASHTQDRVSLHDVLDDALVRVSADGTAGGRVTLNWADPPQVIGDHQRLVRMFELLLAQLLSRPRNDPAHLQISAAGSGDTWEVRIDDDAPPPEGADPLGQLFAANTEGERLSGAMARTLCEAVAASHGGRLWLDGTDEGTGVMVTLPLASATQGPAAPRARRDRHKKSL